MSTAKCTIKKVTNGFIVSSATNTLVVEGDATKLAEFLIKSIEPLLHEKLGIGGTKMIINICSAEEPE